MSDPYEEVVRHPQILWQLFPFDFLFAGLMCPAAADALDDYLRTGDAVAAPEATTERYEVDAHWRRARLDQIVGVVAHAGHGRHVVVHGHRNPSHEFAAPVQDHYFIIANVDDKIYVFDAYGHIVTTEIEEYCTANLFVRYRYTLNYEANETNELSPRSRPRRRRNR
jgi:hypothetical protein